MKTVAFASETDTMYLIGPLLFWACAEMTCGFFIFSVPCLSKLIVESGLPGRVKNSLGFGARSSEPSNGDSLCDSQYGTPPSKPWVTGDTTWSKLEEGHIALQETRSESQTRLHDGVQLSDPKPTVQVTHTTDVTVSNDSH